MHHLSGEPSTDSIPLQYAVSSHHSKCALGSVHITANVSALGSVHITANVSAVGCEASPSLLLRLLPCSAADYFITVVLSVRLCRCLHNGRIIMRTRDSSKHIAVAMF